MGPLLSQPSECSQRQHSASSTHRRVAGKRCWIQSAFVRRDWVAFRDHRLGAKRKRRTTAESRGEVGDVTRGGRKEMKWVDKE